MSKIKIGQILLKNTELTKRQLNFALYVQLLEREKIGKSSRIGHILLDMDCIKFRDLAVAVREQNED